MYAVVVDDDPLNNLLVCEALRNLPGCLVRDFCCPVQALAFAASDPASLGIVLTDYEMPKMDGIDFTEALRDIPGLAHVPVVMITSHGDRKLRRRALDAGVNDFLSKPFDADEVRARTTNLLALSRALRCQADYSARLSKEIAAAVATVEIREREIVTMLMRAAEHRDSDTGDHINRVAAIVELIAEAMGYPETDRRRLGLAATMHDVGKITIPDAVLLKKGPLTPAERSVIETHAREGHRILSGSDAPVVALAAEIALTHHERWDGKGYPNGLSGEGIPLVGRIVAVADVFDALTSDRPYKTAWPVARAKAHMESNAGIHFDPKVVSAFLSQWDAVERIVRSRTKADATDDTPRATRYA
jgi:putative two-component system response regulator